MSRVFKVDYIPDPAKGRPLWNAKIFVGVANQDPTIPSNQIQLTGDIGFPVGQSIPVPQPVRTNAGGITVYNNSPLDLNVPGQAYAIQIFDRNDNLIYNFPQVDGSVVMNTTSQEEVTGLTIWPEVGEAVIGQTIPAGTDAIRYPFNGRSTLFTIKPPVAVTGTITNITINSSGIGELEVDNSDVYDLAEFNSFIAANDGDSQLAGGNIWPLSSQDSLSLGAQSTVVSIDADRFRVDTGSEVELLYLWEPGGTLPSSPFTIENIQLSTDFGYEITINGSSYSFLNENQLNNSVRVSYLDTVFDLINGYGDFADGAIVEIRSFWPGWASLRYPVGGGKFVRNSQRSKDAHNGGLFISPTVPWDGTQGNLEDWLTGVGETDPGGTGCWVRLFDGDECWAEWFGARGDATTVDSPSIDAAVNSKFNVRFRIAEYITTRALKPFSGQTIKGSGVPQIAAQNQGIATILRYTADVDGAVSDVNIALGMSIQNMYMIMDGSVTSTKTGIRLGTAGVQGGSSQSIRSQVINVLVGGAWFNGIESYGWSWELELRNAHVNGFLNRGFRIVRASNIVNLYGCTAMGSIGTPNDGIGITINGENQTAGATVQVYGVNVYGFRSENNRVAARVEGGAVANFYGAYFEGNRFGDIQFRDPYTQLHMTGLTILHGNTGVTTTAAIIVQNTNATSGMVIDGVTYKVTDGTVQAFFQGESEHFSEINKIQWQGDGVPYRQDVGDYSPTRMTFVRTPEIVLNRRGEGSNQMVAEARDNAGSPPTDDSLFEIIDFDGTVRSLLTPGSRVIETGTGTPTTLDYFWTGATWLTRSLTT